LDPVFPVASYDDAKSLNSQQSTLNQQMGKEIPWSYAKIRSGEQLNLKSRTFANVAALTAAGVTAAKNPGALNPQPSALNAQPGSNKCPNK
jgi:hypothetical protein